jgi:hypothetical protein
MNIFRTLPVPTGNGAGAPVSVADLATKTVVVSGKFQATITVEVSNEPADPDDWATVWTTSSPGTTTFDGAFRWMRCTVSGWRNGAAACGLAGQAGRVIAVELPVTPEAGIGEPVLIDRFDVAKTACVGGEFRGNVEIEVSLDGEVWAQVGFGFNAPGIATRNVVAKYARVVRQGVPTINPGLPQVHLSCLDDTADRSSYGTGIDGDLVTSGGGATLHRDVFYRRLTVKAGDVIKAAGYRIHVAEDLVVEPGGVICNDGGDAHLETPGTGAAGGNHFAGGAGGFLAVGSPAGHFPSRAVAAGGQGGDSAAGVGDGYAGGGAGDLGGVDCYTVESMLGGVISGGAGGGCGAASPDGLGVPGAGGGGGGVLVICARHIEAADRSIRAAGGGGGAATVAGGGGGGGQGGVVIVITDDPMLPVIDVGGGGGGRGADVGATGFPGTPGTVIAISPSYGPIG